MNTTDRDPSGYRRNPLPGGPRTRADVIDVYVVRRDGSDAIQFLQVLRATEPLKGSWHPVMGHIEPGETALDAARRELAEELGLDAAPPDSLGMWALEQVHPFYIAAIDCVVLSPRFVVEVTPEWSPRLNAEAAACRWTRDDRDFLWPGQRACLRDIRELFAESGAAMREALRVNAPAGEDFPRPAGIA
jgi:8-oxo-dGTP pyrophosphatase MutT (NUDIX family)